MNDLQIFSNPDFGEIRTVEQDGKVLFCGKDIATALGYTNTKDALSKHCKGVAICYPLQTPGGPQQARFIPEGDVYRLITHSRLPAAEQFEHWVFDEVLPSIRRIGAYGVPPERLAQLNELQARLEEWREREREFSRLTTESRKWYESNRDWRDKCRAHVQAYETAIAAEIKALQN